MYEDSFNPYEDPIIIEKYNVGPGPEAVAGPGKTLYQGFVEEISRIRSINNKLEKSIDGKSVTDVTTESTLTSPTTTDSNVTKSTSDSSVSSPDFIKDQFSPNTLKVLDEEIRINAKCLEDIDKVCKDVETNLPNRERLMDEHKYLLQQRSNHFDSVLEEAKRLPLNDTDMDNLHKEISELKKTVDNLFDKSEIINERNNENSSFADENNSNSKESN